VPSGRTMVTEVHVVLLDGKLENRLALGMEPIVESSAYAHTLCLG